MSDLAEYLQWKRDAAELAALRVEVVALRDSLTAAKRTIRRQQALLSNYRRRYNIEPRSQVRVDILTLIEQGLRNCEIVAKGFNKVTVEKCRRAYRDATNGK